MKSLILLMAVALQASLSFSQTTGNKELFIEVPEQGKVIVYVDDEIIGSSKSLFRFYDISSSNPTVTIMLNNKQIAKAKVQLKPNYRSILSYSRRSGIQVVKTLPIFNAGNYALDDWNGTIGNTPSRPPRAVVRIMDEDSFNELHRIAQKEAFEDARIKVINTALSRNVISTNQLVSLLKTFAFEDNKLSLAKSAYSAIADKENFFKVTDVFTFTSKKEDLLDFIKLKSGR